MRYWQNHLILLGTKLSEQVHKILKLVFLVLLQAYKLILSPMMGTNCRFHPSCSNYAKEAIEHHSVLVALGLITKRIIACRPYGKMGYDPVPQMNSHLRGDTYE